MSEVSKVNPHSFTSREILGNKNFFPINADIPYLTVSPGLVENLCPSSFTELAEDVVFCSVSQ